jgi:pimeloyl-ACP methyl ester carboxylesterase
VPGSVDGAATRRIVVASIALGLLTATQASAATLGPGTVLLTQSPKRTSAGAYSVLGQPVQYVTVDGAALGYRVAGSGRPLVLIGGSSFTMAEWDPVLLDALAAQRRVVIFDNRGAGTSTGSVDALTIARMARDTAQLIELVLGRRADVLGWSMGGYIAQELAIRRPDLVRRLVLASTDCGGPATQGPTKRALGILTNPAATQAQRVSILFPRNRIGAAMLWSGAIGEAYASNGYEPRDAFTVSAETAEAQANAAGPLWLGEGNGTCDRLDQITHDVLLAGGQQDVVVPIANLAALSAGLPHAQSRVHRDAGHAFLFQPGLKFARTVNSFLGM